MAAAPTRTLRSVAYGYQPADGFARRYDAPSARTITRYDAPTNGSTRRLDVPAARVTRYRAPSGQVGATYSAPAARRHTTETGE